MYNVIKQPPEMGTLILSNNGGHNLQPIITKYIPEHSAIFWLSVIINDNYKNHYKKQTNYLLVSVVWWM